MARHTYMPIIGDRYITVAPVAPLKAHEAQARKNHDQSIDDLARRGGLSICEYLAIAEDRPWRKMDAVEAREKLRKLTTVK